MVSPMTYLNIDIRLIDDFIPFSADISFLFSFLEVDINHIAI